MDANANLGEEDALALAIERSLRESEMPPVDMGRAKSNELLLASPPNLIRNVSAPPVIEHVDSGLAKEETASVPNPASTEDIELGFGLGTVAVPSSDVQINLGSPKPLRRAASDGVIGTRKNTQHMSPFPSIVGKMARRFSSAREGLVAAFKRGRASFRLANDRRGFDAIGFTLSNQYFSGLVVQTIFEFLRKDDMVAARRVSPSFKSLIDVPEIWHGTPSGALKRLSLLDRRIVRSREDLPKYLERKEQEFRQKQAREQRRAAEDKERKEVWPNAGFAVLFRQRCMAIYCFTLCSLLSVLIFYAAKALDVAAKKSTNDQPSYPSNTSNATNHSSSGPADLAYSEQERRVALYLVWSMLGLFVLCFICGGFVIGPLLTVCRCFFCCPCREIDLGDDEECCVWRTGPSDDRFDNVADCKSLCRYYLNGRCCCTFLCCASLTEQPDMDARTWCCERDDDEAGFGWHVAFPVTLLIIPVGLFYNFLTCSGVSTGVCPAWPYFFPAFLCLSALFFRMVLQNNTNLFEITGWLTWFLTVLFGFFAVEGVGSFDGSYFYIVTIPILGPVACMLCTCSCFIVTQVLEALITRRDCMDWRCDCNTCFKLPVTIMCCGFLPIALLVCSILAAHGVMMWYPVIPILGAVFLGCSPFTSIFLMEILSGAFGGSS